MTLRKLCLVTNITSLALHLGFCLKASTWNGYILRGKPYSVLNTDWFGCLEVCENDVFCESYNYYHKTGACELHSLGQDPCQLQDSLIVCEGGISQHIRQKDTKETPGKKEAQSCKDLQSQQRDSGIYKIAPQNSDPFPVYCEQKGAGGGWLVIQRRINGSLDFNRTWLEYRQGFGDPSGELWLGLDHIHVLTATHKNTLRVELEDFNGTTAYAEYESFYIGPASDGYRLNIGQYSKGHAGDSMSFHQNMTFSTIDHDSDAMEDESCAQMFTGAWWYKNCHEANLNGRYRHGPHKTFADGINWKTFRGYYYSLKSVRMMIRPK